MRLHTICFGIYSVVICVAMTCVPPVYAAPAAGTGAEYGCSVMPQLYSGL